MQPFEYIAPLDPEATVLLVCDHASPALPEEYAGLGIDPRLLKAQIGHDIGAAFVTHRLAARFRAAAVLARWSRLLLDLNRGPQDPKLIVEAPDGHPIPGNQRIGPTEQERRLRSYYEPYDQAIARELDRIGPSAAVISVHSYAPFDKDVARPWEVGVIIGEDRRLADPLMELLSEHGLVVGNNEPYHGAIEGDCLSRNVTSRGVASVMIEIRHDQLATEKMAQEFADRLYPVLDAALARMEKSREPQRRQAVAG